MVRLQTELGIHTQGNQTVKFLGRVNISEHKGKKEKEKNRPIL